MLNLRPGALTFLAGEMCKNHALTPFFGSAQRTGQPLSGLAEINKIGAEYTRLNEGYSSQMNHKAFDLLVKARIIVTI